MTPRPPRRLEYLDIDKVKPAPRNPKGHDLPELGAAMARFGFTSPVEMDERTGCLVAGHGRIEALRTMRANGEDPPDGIVVITRGNRWRLPVLRGWASLNDDEAEAYLIAANELTMGPGWSDPSTLADMLTGLQERATLVGTGYTPGRLSELLDSLKPVHVTAHDRARPDDETPDPPAEPITRPGDLWICGDHRVLCGDSTHLSDVDWLIGAEPAAVIHADPPYGMGKESDGVLNDNLYGDKLVAFQTAWFEQWGPRLTPNGSVYIWGNAPELWRLWWLGGLDGYDLTIRNEIVWNKGNAPGMGTEAGHSYHTITERCLFLMRGQQFLGNQNTEDYWPGWDPLREWLINEVTKAGWTAKDVNRITGTQMAGHWLTRSQFVAIPAHQYEQLAAAAPPGTFTPTYDELFGQLFPGLRDGGNAHRRDLAAAMRETRTTFNNTHDLLSDVWEFPRVLGEERFGHATPKPVALVSRAVATSTNVGDVVAVPFGGTGPEILACEDLGRRARIMELTPAYVDIIIARWERFTGQKAVLGGA